MASTYPRAAAYRAFAEEAGARAASDVRKLYETLGTELAKAVGK